MPEIFRLSLGVFEQNNKRLLKENLKISGVFAFPAAALQPSSTFLKE